MIVLGIETSCDDTCISIVKDGIDLISIRKSSEKILSNYNGIVPEIASRFHENKIIEIFNEIKSNFDISTIDLISYTSHPGLPGSLHVGKIFAKTLAFILKKEIIGIDHISGHVFSPFINHEEKIKYPFLSLVASGGTTKMFLVNSPKELIVLNSTKDDAIGEAFDKVGRMLGLDYPGGISIDKIFNINKINEELFIQQNPEDNFSFSGIKTKILNYINRKKMRNENIDIVSIASSFQYWSINNLIDKIIFYSNKYNIKDITIGGGVTANSYFRKKIKEIKLNIIKPQKEYTVDNATMIAFLAYLIKKES